ncbi:hypothetical protein EUX48_02850 [Haemophilus haemolyticus]|uniref:Pectate lyase superfamily protein domain-containing protein n=1 Tax=Haemophilus haemolyticus TaxID=726 RepID=A0A502LSP2_HAEHA|nr:phosphodiester glycosidase family protein [Haemophilus haemolyticus]TPH24533.1 hypothetical protein EUX48_02850 [Haemophilus haemolyticus]
MSDEKRTWYQRTHQFTPYTKADGTAVSDEFDAIQASFERIPAMRDDGKGFAVSPVIPTPTEPNHPVPYSMLTETEKSVNNARDEVLEKAQQVAKNTETVATNTKTAINQANSATQSATSAAESSRSADESEDWARKWASNPIDEPVSGDKYSSYHYASKAAKSAENLSIAEKSVKTNADIAAQKADEAAKHAAKAKSIGDGYVEYEKVLNVPRADLNKIGITKLSSDLKSTSNEEAATIGALNSIVIRLDSLVCDSIQQLRHVEPVENNQQIYLKSYHAGSTKGGGYFVADLTDNASADNAGTVIVTGTGKRWKRVLGHTLGLEQFGAIGDGVADDTLAIKNALQAAYDTGCLLNISNGTYLISESLEFKRHFTIGTNVVFQAPENSQDVATNINLYFSRPCHLERTRFIYVNVYLSGQGAEDLIHHPTIVKMCTFNDSKLVIGSEHSITQHYEIAFNHFNTTKSRFLDAIAVKNCNHVKIMHNNIQEYGTGIFIGPKRSFAAQHIKIENNAIQSVMRPIYLVGTSMHRLANVSVVGNTVTRSLRDKTAAVQALYVSYCCGLYVDRNTLTSFGDVIKIDACIDSVITQNKTQCLDIYAGIRVLGCIATRILANTFYNWQPLSYGVLVLDNKTNTSVKKNLYGSYDLTVRDNFFYTNNRGLKIENTTLADIKNNKFYALKTPDADVRLLIFSENAALCSESDNLFFAPDGSALKYTKTLAAGTIHAVKPKKTTVSEPIITHSDTMLNGAKSYVITFSLGHVSDLKQHAGSFKTVSQWMNGSSATLAFNASAWNISTKKTADIVVDGFINDTYGIEDVWWAKSCLFIDKFNVLSCRDFTANTAASVPFMLGTAAMAEMAWQTAVFRSPLVVDGSLYDPISTGIISQNGYERDISARTALGQKGDGTYVLLVVDGRTGERGCTMKQAAEKLLRLGCVNAFNLDGGGSVTLWYKGQIINSPSDDKGEREVPSIFYVQGEIQGETSVL